MESKKPNCGVVGLSALQPMLNKLKEPLRSFVVLHLVTECRDAVGVVRRVYPNSHYPQSLAHQLLQRRRVQKIISARFQRTHLDDVLLDAQRVLKHAERKGTRMKSAVPALEKVVTALERLVATGAN